MIPVLFGGRDRPLIGFHLPAEGGSLGRLAVICPPFGNEFLHADRALRVLSDRLTAAGLDVLRFDWFGTGDSGGDHRELTLRGATQDLLAAIDEGVSVSGGAPGGVVLVGLRHGTLPAVLAAKDEARVERVVLWDPISPDDAVAAWRAHPAAESGGARWVRGFEVSDALLEEMAAIGPEVWGATDRLPSLTVRASTPLPEGLRSRARDEGWPGRVEEFTEPSPWEETAELGAGAVPGAILTAITRWCT